MPSETPEQVAEREIAEELSLRFHPEKHFYKWEYRDPDDGAWCVTAVPDGEKLWAALKRKHVRLRELEQSARHNAEEAKQFEEAARAALRHLLKCLPYFGDAGCQLCRDAEALAAPPEVQR